MSKLWAMSQLLMRNHYFIVNITFTLIAPYSQVTETKNHLMTSHGSMVHHVVLNISRAINFVTCQADPVFWGVLARFTRLIDIELVLILVGHCFYKWYVRTCCQRYDLKAGIGIWGHILADAFHFLSKNFLSNKDSKI